jgi:hypothetical protein
MGKKFLKCNQGKGQWNIGWLGGCEFTDEDDTGNRVCNLGSEAIIVEHCEPPKYCQQAYEVIELARADFQP